MFGPVSVGLYQLKEKGKKATHKAAKPLRAARVYLSLICPAYNEAGSIRSTLGAVQHYLDRQYFSYEVLVAADGDDGTREIVAELARRDPRLHVLGGPGRGGKGRGIRLG